MLGNYIMTTWVLISNNNDFDLDRFFSERQYVDWQQKKNKFEIGDIVYYYCTKPHQRIKYKGIVLQTNVNEKDIEDDSEYWINREAYYKPNTRWMRVQLLSISNENSLKLKDLRAHGFTASVQGPSKVISQELIDYIEKNMQSGTFVYPDSEDVEDTIIEGAVKKVSVNAYERNPIARMKCIEHYGSTCAICGLDFGKYYGEFASGFIHVHHIKPIHEIGKEYVVDPINDLIPVCPNCHAMLHKKLNDGSYYPKSADCIGYIIPERSGPIPSAPVRRR